MDTTRNLPFALSRNDRAALRACDKAGLRHAAVSVMASGKGELWDASVHPIEKPDHCTKLYYDNHEQQWEVE